MIPVTSGKKLDGQKIYGIVRWIFIFLYAQHKIFWQNLLFFCVHQIRNQKQTSVLCLSISLMLFEDILVVIGLFFYFIIYNFVIHFNMMYFFRGMMNVSIIFRMCFWFWLKRFQMNILTSNQEQLGSCTTRNEV